MRGDPRSIGGGAPNRSEGCPGKGESREKWEEEARFGTNQ